MNEVMKTEQDWENYHKRIDKKKVKKIKRCNILSTAYMICGIGCVTLGSSMIRGIIKLLSEITQVTGALTSDDIFSDENILFLAALSFIFLAIKSNNDKLMDEKPT